MIRTLNCWFLESQMSQNKFSSWVKMLVNLLKPNVFNIIHVDWRLGKQLRTIFKKKDEKKWSIHVDLGLPYKFTSLVCEPKKEDLVLEAQINFPYENFPNMPAERKRPRSTLLFIDLNKFWRKKKKTEHDLYWTTNTIKNPNIHNSLKED